MTITSCGSIDRHKAEEYRLFYERGEYCQASEVSLGTSTYCSRTSKTKDFQDLDILDALNGGSSLFALGFYDNSDALFSYSTKEIDKYEKANLLSEGGRAAIDILGNASFHGYTPYIMDSIYAGAYLILGNLALGDKEGARVEVNRVYHKQQEASEVFRQEIKAQEEGLNRDKSQLDKNNLEMLAKNEREIVSKYYDDIKKWGSYKDFMNPYVTYLSGLYFLNNSSSLSDYEVSLTYLKRVSGMVPNNRTILEDLKLSERYANNEGSRVKKGNYVWVIFENGMVGRLEEISLNIPMFLVTREVSMISFSLPRPRVGKEAYKFLEVSLGNSKKKTELLTDVDSLFISEFNKRFPVILSKAIASTTIKAIMQYGVHKNDSSGLGGLVMGLYTLATSGADLRSWQSLPKNVQVTRLPIDGGEELKILAGGKEVSKINIPMGKNSIVYIRIPEAGVKPSVSLIEL